MIETVAGLTDLQIKLLTAVGQIAMGLALGSITAFIAWKQSNTAAQQARIAEQQAKTARNKLRLELFTRRLKIFESVDQIARLAISADTTEHKEVELCDLISESRWLFSPTVSEFVSKHIYEKLVDHRARRVLLAQLGAQLPFNKAEQREHDQASGERHDLARAVLDNLKRLREDMDDYLILED